MQTFTMQQLHAALRQAARDEVAKEELFYKCLPDEDRLEAIADCYDLRIAFAIKLANGEEADLAVAKAIFRAALDTAAKVHCEAHQ